jgi:hypothetical protein
VDDPDWYADGDELCSGHQLLDLLHQQRHVHHRVEPGREPGGQPELVAVAAHLSRWRVGGLGALCLLGAGCGDASTTDTVATTVPSFEAYASAAEATASCMRDAGLRATAREDRSGTMVFDMEVSGGLSQQRMDEIFGMCAELPCDLRVGSFVSGGETVASSGTALEALNITTERTDLPDGPLVLSVGSMVVDLDRDGLVVDSSALEELGPVLAGLDRSPDGVTESVIATVRLRDPVRASVVPASAVIATGAGACVVVGSVTSPQVIPVIVVDSFVGSSTVVPAASGRTIPATAVRNASLIEPPLACPS